MAFLDNEGLERLWDNIIRKLAKKVDKVEGKSLSTNDYTTEEKNKLAEMVVRLEALEKIINNSPLVDGVEGVGTLDAGTILDTDPSEINIIDPNTTT